MGLWNDSSGTMAKPAVTPIQLNNLARFMGDLYRRAVVEARLGHTSKDVWYSTAGEMLERIAPGIQYDFIDCHYDVETSIAHHIQNLQLAQTCESDGLIMSGDPEALRNTVKRSMAAMAAGWVGLNQQQFTEAMLPFDQHSHVVPAPEDTAPIVTGPQLLFVTVNSELRESV